MTVDRASLKSKFRAGRAAETAPQGETVPARKDSTIDLGSLPQFIGYALRRAQLAVFQDFIASLASIDVRPAQFAVLAVIAANPGLRQSQVSDALGIKRANFVVMLHQLERRGLVKRLPVASDRRSYALHLTADGGAFVERMSRLHAEHENRLADRLGHNGKRQLLSLLERLCEPLR